MPRSGPTICFQSLNMVSCLLTLREGESSSRTKIFKKQHIRSLTIWKVLDFSSKQLKGIGFLRNMFEKFRILQKNFVKYLFWTQKIQKVFDFGSKHLRSIDYICKMFEKYWKKHTRTPPQCWTIPPVLDRDQSATGIYQQNRRNQHSINLNIPTAAAYQRTHYNSRPRNQQNQ